MFVKSRSDWYSLDWSRAKHYWYCCQAISEWRTRLLAGVRIVGQHFKQFYCKQLKNGQDKMSAKVSEMW